LRHFIHCGIDISGHDSITLRRSTAMVNASSTDLQLLEQEVQELLDMMRTSGTDFVVWNQTMMKKLEGIHALALRLKSSGK